MDIEEQKAMDSYLVKRLKTESVPQIRLPQQNKSRQKHNRKMKENSMLQSSSLFGDSRDFSTKDQTKIQPHLAASLMAEDTTQQANVQVHDEGGQRGAKRGAKTPELGEHEDLERSAEPPQEQLEQEMRDVEMCQEDERFLRQMEQACGATQINHASTASHATGQEDEWLKLGYVNKDLNLEYNQQEHGNFKMKRDTSREHLKHNIFEITKLTNNQKQPSFVKSEEEQNEKLKMLKKLFLRDMEYINKTRQDEVVWIKKNLKHQVKNQVDYYVKILNNKFKAEMGDKNIKMQDTQKESQEKETEINDLKEKVFSNEMKINELQLRQNELMQLISSEEQRIMERRQVQVEDAPIEEEVRRREDAKIKETQAAQEREKAHHFLKQMIEDLEVLCWVNQKDGRDAEEKAYNLEQQQRQMQTQNEQLTKKMIKQHEDNVSEQNLEIQTLAQEFTKQRKEINQELQVKDEIQNQVRKSGDSHKDELILLRKIIMNKKMVTKYKEKVEQIARNQDSHNRDTKPMSHDRDQDQDSKNNLDNQDKNEDSIDNYEIPNDNNE